MAGPRLIMRGRASAGTGQALCLPRGQLLVVVAAADHGVHRAAAGAVPYLERRPGRVAPADVPPEVVEAAYPVEGVAQRERHPRPENPA